MGRPARILSDEETKDIEAEVAARKHQVSATQLAVAEMTEDVERLVWRFRSSQTSVQQNDANFGIGTLVRHGDMTLAEALVDYAERKGDHNLEAVASLVRRSRESRRRLEVEAQSRRMLKTPHGATRIEEDEPVAFVCDECGMEFESAFGLGIHMSRGRRVRKRATA